MAKSPRKLRFRSVFAAACGNILEWYDFTVYSFLAPTLASQFFPSNDHTASLLSAFAVLAVGYAARPVGSVIFGHLGDRWGRKPVLILSVVIMGGSSVSIALLPTHEQIGVAAAVLLVIIRVVQGISVAGEYTASGVLLVEQAAEGQKVLAGSWVACAMIIGCVLGAAVPTVVSWFLSESQLVSWGWRIPFFLGGGVAFLSMLLRRSLTESRPELEEDGQSPALQTLMKHPMLLVEMIVLLSPSAVLYFVTFVFAISSMGSEQYFTTSQALDISTLNLIVLAISIPVIGHITDKVGIRPVLIFSSVVMIIIIVPSWWLMHRPDLGLVFIGQFALAIINAPLYALSVSVLTLMAPAHLRCSTVAIAYNICMAVFGGTTPMVITYLIRQSGDIYIPTYYVLTTSVIALLVIWRVPMHINRSIQAERVRVEQT
ncbi:MFS transporter [Flexibacterium corallicola]|uniref:MFS transporter n=1 Tax=Flexibacterium corallicola TaxID=3037259 RepID=UPI00286F5ECB|nr:MFS transporter [Pseudovibrio sp. M1P-2-3]